LMERAEGGGNGFPGDTSTEHEFASIPARDERGDMPIGDDYIGVDEPSRPEKVITGKTGHIDAANKRHERLQRVAPSVEVPDELFRFHTEGSDVEDVDPIVLDKEYRTLLQNDRF